jgi:sec-independent protein translocase protein TatA
MPNLGTTEIIIIALVVLVLFGSKKLPDAARSFGRSLRIFKAETKGLREDEVSSTTTTAAAPAPAAQPVAPLPIEARPAPAPATSVNGASPVDAERR